jgi:hypothetical protein
MSIAEPLPTLNRAELGRTYWNFIHTEANLLKTHSDLQRFISTVHHVLADYPCVECRTHLQHNCAHFLSNLHELPQRAAALGQTPNPWRTVAVAWAARCHACVTAHLQSDGHKSRRSVWIARQVARLGDDDEAIAQMFHE